MTTLAEVEFPLRTVSALNEREHWGAKARRVKRERKVTRIALATGPTWRGQARAVRFLANGKPLVVELTRLSRGELDDDNLRGALKSVRDQVAEWLGVDDRDPRVTWAYGQARARGFGVRIRIEREEAACPTS